MDQVGNGHRSAMSLTTKARQGRRAAGSASLGGVHFARIMNMRLGVDFDNTIVSYDALFHRVCRERELIPAEVPVSKSEVRNYLRRAGQEPAWTEMQGYVYGARMSEAAPYPGVLEFFQTCRQAGIETSIVSHKTRYGHFDPAHIDLREAARRWMIEQGILAPEKGGIPADHVFFEDDRASKLARIGALGCTHFIDDLEEVFADPGFPHGVRRVLFAATGAACCDVHCKDWQQISAAIFGDAA